MVDEYTPDLVFISESNFWAEIPSWETLIQGYEIIHPKSFNVYGISRIILLVKDNVQIKILDDLMESEISTEHH